jgi:secretion/DNA translocation related CpaE-like protein
MERPLVISDDHRVLDELVRIAAAAQVDVAICTELPGRPRWRSAPAVILDARLVAVAVRAGLPRRSGVVVVAADVLDAPTWSSCVRLGAEHAVGLSECDAVLVEMLAAAVDPEPGDGRCLAVLGACGGAGASVLAVALAVAAARSADREAFLVDCDPWGCGADALLGIQDGLRWHDLAASGGRLPSDALRSGLPSVPVRHGRVVVLCHDRDRPSGPPAQTLDVVLESTRRSGSLAVVDLPRQPGEAADRAIERADLTVLVVPADVRGCLAGRKVRDRVNDLGGRLAAVVRGPCPSGVGPDDVAEAIDVQVVARMRGRPSLARELDHGRIPGLGSRGPVARAAEAVLAAAGALPTRRGPS